MIKVTQQVKNATLLTTVPQFSFNISGIFSENFFFFFFDLFTFSRAARAAYGGSQARRQIGAVATGLSQSHSKVGSKPRLQPTPQLLAMIDP